jgi:hypothetical protein
MRAPRRGVWSGVHGADQLRALSVTPQEAFVAHRITFRLLVILTALLAAAFNGGWKWDAFPH